VTNGVAIVTPNEVCDLHGTGVILSRCFRDFPNVISIRSADHYNNEHHLGRVQIRASYTGLSRNQAYEKLLKTLAGQEIKYVVCVPFFSDDLLSAIILKEAFGAKLCVYLMDDNHLVGVVGGGIPEPIMREAVEKADLRLAISPEMRDAYENQFRLKFWLRPPVVTPESVSSNPRIPANEVLIQRKGIVVGNLWSSQALERLAKTVQNADLVVDWFGNSGAPWLQYDPNWLNSTGIRVCGFLPETDLAARLGDYAFALVPSGTLESDDLRADIARYSLPTRMPFLLAVGNIPTIVLGNRRTAAAGFVDRFGHGAVVRYDGLELREAVDRICAPAAQRNIRARCAALAEQFSAAGVGKWILDSIDLGRAASTEMEELMPRRESDFAYFIQPPTPPDIVPDFVPVYHGLSKLQQANYRPDFVVDVGASTGIWSTSVGRLFPRAQFVLVEPLLSLYGDCVNYVKAALPGAKVLGLALSDRQGEIGFRVSSDLYGSSLLSPNDGRHYECRIVPVSTLDQVAENLELSGRGILKLDVQGAEHLVLAGCPSFIQSVDVLIAELSMYRYLAEESKSFDEMYSIISALGFRYFDDVGEWRSPKDGRLLQKDVLFVRETLFSLHQ
jgi:FkbM family methyltransferase